MAPDLWVRLLAEEQAEGSDTLVLRAGWGAEVRQGGELGEHRALTLDMGLCLGASVITEGEVTGWA